MNHAPFSDGAIDVPTPGSIARRLAESILADRRTHHLSGLPLPDRAVVINLLDQLTWLVFPGFFGPRDLTVEGVQHHIEAALNEIAPALAGQIAAALRYEVEATSSDPAAPTPTPVDQAGVQERAKRVVQQFLVELPEVRRMLSLDVQAAFDGDPAAHHTDEVIFSYPGLRAVTVHRLAHELYLLDVPLIPRIMSEYAHSITGIDIHPGARIGPSFFIDHGTGVVIGETSVIGDHCRIYQGVTLGAKGFPKDEFGRLKRGLKRHPTLEDHVTVYAGATILGGDTIIGAGSVINGGVFLTESVPPASVVRAPKAELKVRSNPELPPTSYSI